MAISAVDSASWDLKAKLLGMPLVVLLGKCRDRVPIYGVMVDVANAGTFFCVDGLR